VPTLVPRARTTKLSIKNRATNEAPATPPTPETPPNPEERPSAIDEVTPSFNRNVSGAFRTLRAQVMLTISRGACLVLLLYGLA